MSEIFKNLENEVRLRDWTQGQNEIDELTSVYEGELPARFHKYFPESSPKHIINMTRLAWDDLAGSIGRMPEVRAEPESKAQKERDRAAKLEKIAQSYLQYAEPNGKLFLRQLAWWLLAGRGVAVVLPDYEKGRPQLSIRDPRSAYPGVNRMAGGNITKLKDIIFKYELPASAMRDMGLEVGFTEEPWTGKKIPNESGTVIEYMDDMNHIICSDGGTVKTWTHGLGVVPAHVFQTFSPNKAWGVSQFSDQLSYMVAISQMISMKIAQAERLTYPMMWVKGHEGRINIGPMTLNKLSATGEMGQISPPATIQVDRDIDMLSRFARIHNRNPESRQGEVSGSGYVSAKTVEELSESIDTVISNYWALITDGLEHLLAVCLRMDEKLWPSKEKPISQIVKGKRVRSTYTPKDDIAGFYEVELDYGFGLGGYQGFLQNVQAKDAGLQSRRKTMEAMPGMSDVDGQIREMELEAMYDAGNALFLAQAQQGALDMKVWAKLAKEMADKGTPLHEIIVKYQEELEEQAQAVAEDETTQSVTAAPPAEEAPVEAGPQGPPPMPLGAVI